MTGRLRVMVGKIGNLVTLALFAVWWGGFTFYAVIVVPTGHMVLHSRVRQGFITQQVTNWLNLIGVVVLVAFLVRIIIDRPPRSTVGRSRIAFVSWSLTAVTLAGLYWMHPHLDGFLDPVSRTVSNDDLFYTWHRWYLVVATLQWVAGAVLGAVVLTDHRPEEATFIAPDLRG